MREREISITYDVDKGPSEGQIAGDSVHEVKHMGLALLVLILDVTVTVESSLDAPNALSGVEVITVHLKHARE